MTATEVIDVKAALTEGLTELRLPTVRLCYEETARLAERETLSYERYLLQLVTRECEDRQRKRIQRLLILELNIPSYRDEQAKKAKTEPATE